MGKQDYNICIKENVIVRLCLQKDNKETSTKLAKFVTTIPKAENLKSNCTYLELAQKYLDDYVETQYTYKNVLNNRILLFLVNIG